MLFIPVRSCKMYAIIMIVIVIPAPMPFSFLSAISETSIQREFGHGSAGEPVALTGAGGPSAQIGPNTRRSLTGGASKPYRAGAWLFSTGFFGRGLGWRAVGPGTAAPLDGFAAVPPQRLIPKHPSTGC